MGFPAGKAFQLIRAFLSENEPDYLFFTNKIGVPVKEKLGIN
jgi:hypothetical protein